ncbi:phage major tail tube protein [Serratia marcescens]|uniref:Phage major tail tube protein n=1 Tax=Serratia marcescens TaxID=615 RepID=A0A5C7CIB0_SERMA|nr:phage major tail tube protein [Serratia marcescens]TXE33258.1 phage major tail tube protein [Serratia marcescens]TXE65218.1 phage major tail tube protein [Serratia marcescens]
MALPRKLKHLNVFLNGISYHGVAESVTLPKLTRKMEAWRGAGMNGAAQVDMGLDDEALTLNWTLGGYDAAPYKQMGSPLIDGAMIRFAGSLQRDDTGEISAIEVVVRGRHKEIDSGDSKGGEGTSLKITTECTYYKLTIDGEDIIEIDNINLIENVDGNDRLAQHRKNIGLM